MLRKVIITFITLLVLLTVAEFLFRTLNIPKYITPLPTDVAKYAIENSAVLAKNTWVTGVEAVLGFFLAAAIGSLSGILLYGWVFSRGLAYSLGAALQAIPIIALAPLFTIWFGFGLFPKIAMAAIICYPIILVAVVRGLSSTSIELIELFASLGSSKWQTFVRARIPFALRELALGARLSAQLAVIGAIVAEYSGASQGLGYQLTQAVYRSSLDSMYAAVLCATLLGISISFVVDNGIRELFSLLGVSKEWMIRQRGE